MDTTPPSYITRIINAQDSQRAQPQGGFVKVKFITYMVGNLGPFTADVPDVDGWEQTARTIMTNTANSLRNLGV